MNSSIFISLLQNATILLAFSMLYEHLWIKRENYNELTSKIFTGIIIGAIGVLIMLTPWVLKEGVMFDTRSIVLSITGYFFGLIPTLIAVVFTAAFRIYQGGDGLIMGVLVILTSATIGLLYRYFKPIITGKYYYLHFLSLGYMVHIIMGMLILTLPKETQLLSFNNLIIPLLTFYPFTNMILAVLFRNQKINHLNREASKKLSETEKKLSSILKSGNILCVIIDKNGNIDYSNEFLLQLTKYNFEDIRGKNWFSLFIPDKNYEKTRQLFLETKRNKKLKFDNVNRIKTKSNEELIVSWFNTVIYDEDGKLKNLISVGVDITEAKLSEKKLIQRNKELVIAKENLQKTDRLKNEFINNMSHEIRTPMNGILGFLGLMEATEVDTNTKKEYFKIIRNSSKQLLRIIDDLMEISQLSTKQVKVYKDKVKLYDVFAELYSIFKINNQNTNVQIFMEADNKDKNLLFETDKSKLDKILGNLIENALKFTINGFVKFGYKVFDNELIIFVEDSGIGIEESKQKLIFKRFIRGNIEEGFAFSGLGLGLSIVKENTDLLDGKISLKSELNIGSRFEIKFKNT